MRSQDDLRRLVEDDLAVLAYQIMSSGPRRMPSAAFRRRNRNWVHAESTDWSRVDRKGKLPYLKVGTINGKNAYSYGGYDYDGNVRPQWYIAFYNVRLTDIEKVEPQPVEVLNPEAVRLVSVDSTQNDGPGFIDYEINRTERHEKGREHSFGVLAATEFENSLTRKAGGSFNGIEASAEMTTRFSAKLEARTDHAWRSSDTLESSIKKSYQVFPYHDFECLIKEGTPRLRQTIPTTGTLECSIRIDIRDANAQDFDTYSDLVEVWRGVRGGSEAYSSYFSGGGAVPDSEIEDWRSPRVTLNLQVQGDRVRYSNTQYIHHPIPGKEKVAEEYRQAKLDAIK